ncbi:MAG: HD domain-containing protein [Lachnospiraceae bacterium]|nr:HD domain-containing protein [Lachnospiraceae bacterium]
MKNPKHVNRLLARYGGDILKSESYLKNKGFVQHGNVSVYRHCINVAQMSLRIGRRLPVAVSEREMVRGALLHDYFLYDWHGKKVGLNEILHFYKMHGFTHPKEAAKNAERDFRITPLEREIILKHMWPLTILDMPTCREAWIVTAADKYVSFLETIHVLKGDL